MSGDVNSVRPLPGRDDPHHSTMPEPGSVHVITGNHRTRVVLSGEIDAELGPALLESAAEAAEAGVDVEVDVQHVTFMDSTGVAFLARVAKDAVKPVVLLRPNEEVRFLLDITAVSDLFVVRDADPGPDASIPAGGG